MTNFQFYLNSLLQGCSILGPADGFFLKASSAFYLLFLGAAAPSGLGFAGAAGRGAALSIPAQAGSGGFALSPGLLFPVLTKAEAWNNNCHHPK